MREPLLQYPIVQFAYVVADLDEAMRHWVEVMGAGPFFVMRDFLGNDLTYRGSPSSTRVSYAFGQCGPAQVQLIAQDDPGPSIYRDMYAPGEGGFHHVCALVPMEHWDEQVARFTDAGYELASLADDDGAGRVPGLPSRPGPLRGAVRADRADRGVLRVGARGPRAVGRGERPRAGPRRVPRAAVGVVTGRPIP